MPFKILLSATCLLLLSACTTVVRVPLTLTQPQEISLQQSIDQGTQLLLEAIEEERGWKTELLPTYIVVTPTVNQNNQQAVAIGTKIDRAIRLQAYDFPKLQLVDKGVSLRTPTHYYLHSALLSSRQSAEETIIFKMWAENADTHRTIASSNARVAIISKVTSAKIQENTAPQGWQAALKQASQQLLDVASQDRSWHSQLSDTHILLAPAFDVLSSETLDINQEWLARFQQQARQFSHIKIAPLSSAALRQAHYVVYSALTLNKASGGQFYQLDVWMQENPSGRLLAHNTSRVPTNEIKYEVSAASKDSPVYVETPSASQSFDLQQQLRKQGTYSQSVQLDALLADGGLAYKQGQYALALAAYQTATSLPGGNTNLRALAGRYMSLLRLERKPESRQAFTDLLLAGFNNSDQLTFKILFGVNSAEFSGGAFLTDQYQVWVEEMAGYLHKASACMQVTGHSSRSGSDSYNQQLSAKRAARIQELMAQKQASVGQRVQTEGKGFHENIVGTGSDDFRDAVDRRVEFRKVGCP